MARRSIPSGSFGETNIGLSLSKIALNASSQTYPESQERPGALAFATDGEYLYFTWEETLGDIWVMDVVWDE